MAAPLLPTTRTDIQRQISDLEQEIEDDERALALKQEHLKDLRKQLLSRRSRRSNSSSGDWALPSSPEAWIKFIIVVAIAFFASLVVANVALDMLKDATNKLEPYRFPIEACIVLIATLTAYLKAPRD